jgi:flavodoxin
MADTLVVYYSRTGTTEAAARRVADALGADLETISPAARYEGVAGFLRCVFQATGRECPPIGATRDPSGYRLVVVGSPVWAGCLASPVRSYLTAHRERLPEVAAFCTSGSGVADGVFAQVEQIAGRPLRGALSLKARAVDSGKAGPELAEWAQSLDLQPTRGAEAA